MTRNVSMDEVVKCEVQTAISMMEAINDKVLKK